VLPGGGLRLLPDGVSGGWHLASSTTLPDGAMGLHYRRRYPGPSEWTQRRTGLRMA
jgi:hypothetical protein